MVANCRISLKLRLKFRKPAKHTFHICLQPAPFHNEAGKGACRDSWNAQGLLAGPVVQDWLILQILCAAVLPLDRKNLRYTLPKFEPKVH